MIRDQHNASTQAESRRQGCGFATVVLGLLLISPIPVPAQDGEHPLVPTTLSPTGTASGLARPTGNPGIKPGSFPAQSIREWQEKSFSGHTEYSLVPEGEQTVLRGIASSTASVLYRKQSVDLEQRPILTWTWKVDRTFADLDEQSRSGDDFPARLYVVAKTGLLPWDTVAINYVWSSSTPVDSVWTNPFTRKSRMYAVQSGSDRVGEWVRQQRDVAQDFREIFGKRIRSIEGYAVMVDGDNSGNSATAWFGDIVFSER